MQLLYTLSYWILRAQLNVFPGVSNVMLCTSHESHPSAVIKNTTHKGEIGMSPWVMILTIMKRNVASADFSFELGRRKDEGVWGGGGGAGAQRV